MGLGSVELLMAIESHFQVDVPDADASRMATVGEIHEWLCPELTSRAPSLSGRSARNLSEDEIWDELAQLISDHLGLPLVSITPQAHIIHDLGVD